MPQPPHIVSCTEWGAQPVQVAFSEAPAQGIIIHNTADPNRAPLTGAAELHKAEALARSIQHFHMAQPPQGRGWADSGQHFLISKGGVILEGRHGSLAAAKEGHVVRGAHANSTLYNKQWFGIEVEGDYVHGTLDDLPPAQWAALVELCSWLSYWGSFQSLNVKGHKEVAGPGHTDCPGKLMQRLPDLSEAIHQRKTEIANGGAEVLLLEPVAPIQFAGIGDVLQRIADRENSEVIHEQLQGLSSMKKVYTVDGAHSAFLSVSDLDLDTDGIRDPRITYEATHQDQTSIDPNGRWLDSNKLNYFVLPGGFGTPYRGETRHGGVGLGCLATVVYENKIAHAIFADTGPVTKYGEGSMRLHRALGFERLRENGHIINAGIDAGVWTLIYVGSHLATPCDQAAIDAAAQPLWDAFTR